MSAYDYSGRVSFATPALTNSVVIPGRCVLFGFTISSTNLAAQFVQIFDRAALPADTAVPIAFASVSATNQLSAYYGEAGRVFYQGIALCNSTTAGTKTLGAADSLFDVQYMLLDFPGDYPDHV